uniref:oligopeptidase A n=1 Tax=Chlamydomonas euryale TaxID=1486919 RepID=A0A7R9VQR7_9CHLO
MSTASGASAPRARPTALSASAAASAAVVSAKASRGRGSGGASRASLVAPMLALAQGVLGIGEAADAAAAAAAADSNCLLRDWDSTEPYGLPPFAEVETQHFRPALEVALAEHLSQVTAVADCKEAPTFENTVLVLDRAGSLLDRVSNLFFNLCSSNTSPELQEIELAMAPVLAAHDTMVYTLPGLFKRLDTLYSQRDTAGLDAEQLRLLERLHLDFVRAGARFEPQQQARYGQIMERLAELTTKFTQNILADESEFTLPLSEADMSGCPPELVAAAKQAAHERGRPEGECVVTLSRSLVEPFLTFSDRRDLREKAWRAWTQRGELDAKRDNHPIMREILQLRAEQAALHGYQSFAEYQTADTMAQRPARVMELLEEVWGKAKVSANAEREALAEFVASQESAAADACPDIQPWDWRYYAEKVRQSRYNFDEGELKPYFSLDAMTAAIFDVANRLFGLSFVHKEDVQAYHPDVKVYEVRETVDGEERLVAVFLHDNFSRANKKSGAWMSELRSACPDIGRVPIILNNNNFAKASAGEPTLLSFDDARTLFHEFGHGLHGMLSRTRYLRLAGTNVLRDFVELPSQLMEHWMEQPEVLRAHARHYKTGEAVPDALLDRLKAARAFNQGFATVEYTSSALMDQSLHQLPADALKDLDLNEFEKTEMARLGMPQGMVMRHRPAHFQHLFSTSMYASAYYVYLWAEVLDADGFEAFMEAGSCFDADTAARVRRCIYASGNSMEPGEAYRMFRGRDPVIEPMLKKKGMLAVAGAAH